jgi:pimeloyl-ACP methyl ester carboxylesterase
MMDRTQLVRLGVKALGYISPTAAAEIALRLFTTPHRIARPSWEKEILARGKPLALSDGLRATSWGDETLPIVVLLHGWQGRGSQLGLLVDPLLQIGYRVVALDGPAHGDSAGSRTNVWFFSLALSRVAEELGPLKAIVAHSFGASATAFAVARGMKVEQVVLVASPSDLMWVIEGFCKGMGFPPRVEKVFLRRLAAWSGVDPKSIMISSVGDKVKIPALIVHDPLDREVPFSNAETIVRHWKTATLLPLEKVGHRKILKAPAFVKAVTEFLGPAVASKQIGV